MLLKDYFIGGNETLHLTLGLNGNGGARKTDNNMQFVRKRATYDPDWSDFRKLCFRCMIFEPLLPRNMRYPESKVKAKTSEYIQGKMELYR